MKTLYEYIREAKVDNFADVKKEDKTFKEIMSGLSKQGLKYAGTMYWTNKDINGFYPDELDGIFEYYKDLEKKICGRTWLYTKSLDVYTGKMKIKDWPGICDPKSKEEVVRFTDKDTQGRNARYFCFYSTAGKYYYMINLKRNSSWIGDWDRAVKALQIWVDVKTKPESELKSEFQAMKDAADRAEAERLVRAEKARKEKEEAEALAEAAKKRVDALKEQLADIRESIYDHYKEHKDEYIECYWGDLEDKIQADIELADKAKTEDDYKEVLKKCKYFEFMKKIDSDPAGTNYLCLVNTKDFQDPHAYRYSRRNRWSLD